MFARSWARPDFQALNASHARPRARVPDGGKSETQPVNAEMRFKVYGKWIDGTDKSR